MSNDIIEFENGDFINKKDVEQIEHEIIKIFAQHKLSYNESIYCLKETKEKLLSRCIVKD